MTDLSKIYLELLRAGLWDRPEPFSGSVRLSEILELAQKQGTLPLVCYGIIEGLGNKSHPKLKEQLSAHISKCEEACIASDKVINFVREALEEHDIHPVLLKGQGIGAWYDLFLYRQPGDIDLYVHHQDFDEALEILCPMFPDYDQETDKHVAFHVGGSLVVELHKYTEVLPSRRQNAFYQKISDKGTSEDLVPVLLVGGTVMTPEDTFNVFYIFHHLWEHIQGMGIGMRQLCDWAVMLRTHTDMFDTEALEHWLRRLHLKNVWQVFGCAVVQALGLEPEEIPFYDATKSARGARLLEFILEQGDNREFKHGRSGQSALKHKTGSLKYIFKKFGRMFPIFPWIALKLTVRDCKNGLGKLLKHRSF